MTQHQLSLLGRAIPSIGLLLLGLIAPLQQANAHHWPSSCGGENQKACTLIQHVPSCKGGLVEKPLRGKCVKPAPRKPLIARPKNCGGQGQKPCPLPHIPSCNGNLVEDFVKGMCRRNDGDIVNMAKNLLRERQNLLSAAGRSIVSCGIDAIMQTQKDKAVLIQQIQNSACFAHIKQNARQLGYNTITIGASGSVAFLVGASGENGFAFDVNGRNPVATYHTLGVSFGSIGSDVAVIVGFYKKDNLSFGGDGHGAAVSFTAAGGKGAAAWFEYNGQVAGLNAFVTAGAGGDFGYVRTTTKVMPVRFKSGGSQVGESGGDYDEGYDEGYDEDYEYGPNPPDYEREPAQTEFERSQQAARELGTEIGLAIRARREADAKRTQMKFCNKTKAKKLSLAYAYWREASIGGEAGWFMKGWWQIKRNRCQANHYLPEGPDGLGRDYRVYLVSATKNKKTGEVTIFGGQGKPLCINNKGAFAYSNASTRLCNGPTDKFVRSIEFEVTRGLNTYTFRE